MFIFLYSLLQDNIREVSKATEMGDGFDFRPGENLGVILGLQQQRLSPDDDLEIAVSACILACDFVIRCCRGTALFGYRW